MIKGNIFRKEKFQTQQEIRKDELDNKIESKRFSENTPLNSKKTFKDFFTKWRHIIFNVLFSPTHLRSKKYLIIATCYVAFIALASFLSVIPLVTDRSSDLRKNIDMLSYFHFLIALFIFDWIFRLSFGDLYVNKGEKKWTRFLRYSFHFMSIVDLISWLVPLVLIINVDLGDIQLVFIPIFLMLKSITSFRIIYIFNKDEGIRTFMIILKKSSKLLFFVVLAMMFFVFIFSIIVYNFEIIDVPLDPGATIKTVDFFDAFWMCFITITTIGYGDVYPVTASGRVVIMLLALLGIGFYSFLTSIIVNSFSKYLDELRRKRELKSIESSKKMLEDYKQEIGHKLSSLNAKENFISKKVKESEKKINILEEEENADKWISNYLDSQESKQNNSHNKKEKTKSNKSLSNKNNSKEKNSATKNNNSLLKEKTMNNKIDKLNSKKEKSLANKTQNKNNNKTFVSKNVTKKK